VLQATSFVALLSWTVGQIALGLISIPMNDKQGLPVNPGLELAGLSPVTSYYNSHLYY